MRRDYRVDPIRYQIAGAIGVFLRDHQFPYRITVITLKSTDNLVDNAPCIAIYNNYGCERKLHEIVVRAGLLEVRKYDDQCCLYSISRVELADPEMFQKLYTLVRPAVVAKYFQRRPAYSEA